MRVRSVCACAQADATGTHARARRASSELLVYVEAKQAGGSDEMRRRGGGEFKCATAREVNNMSSDETRLSRPVAASSSSPEHSRRRSGACDPRCSVRSHRASTLTPLNPVLILCARSAASPVTILRVHQCHIVFIVVEHSSCCRGVVRSVGVGQIKPLSASSLDRLAAAASNIS